MEALQLGDVKDAERGRGGGGGGGRGGGGGGGGSDLQDHASVEVSAVGRLRCIELLKDHVLAR